LQTKKHTSHQSRGQSSSGERFTVHRKRFFTVYVGITQTDQGMTEKDRGDESKGPGDESKGPGDESKGPNFLIIDCK